MFENVKKEPEDIFDKTDGIKVPTTPPPTQPNITPSTSQVPPLNPVASTVPLVFEKKGTSWKSILIIIGGGILIAAAAYLISRILLSAPSIENNLPNVSNTAATEQTKTNQAKNSQENKTNSSANSSETIQGEQTPKEVSEDVDKDGLTDDREKELGTSLTEEDTDKDGLSDREEVETYKTDPLSSDTDGDGYTDGGEVENGYNPNGSGKLYTVPGTN